MPALLIQILFLLIRSAVVLKKIFTRLVDKDETSRKQSLWVENLVNNRLLIGVFGLIGYFLKRAVNYPEQSKDFWK